MKYKSKKTIILAEDTKSDEHMIHLEHQVDKNFDENYTYYIKNPFAKFFARILLWIAICVLWTISKCKHGMQFKQNKTFKTLKKSGKGWISVSNHNLILDCYAAEHVNLYRKTYIPTVEETMKIPGVRHILRAINVIPIPSNPRGLVKFKDTVNLLISEGKILHFFPEGSLWPYYSKLRTFKPGAFRFARDNNVPIVPFCIYFRPRRGLWKLFGKNPLVTVEVLEPMYPDMDIPKKQAIAKISDDTFIRMNEVIVRNYIDTSKYSFISSEEKIAIGIMQGSVSTKTNSSPENNVVNNV